MTQSRAIRVRIVYMAAARELAGTREEVALVHDAAPHDAAFDVAAFKRWLAVHKPRLAPYLARMRVARNAEFASEQSVIEDDDELTLLPPVAGGSALAEVRTEPLSIDEVVQAVRHPSAGGIAIFLGVVRDHHQGEAVQRLDYEAYVELANKEMARILDELMRTHPNTRLAALHRVGELAIGDTAVVVAASAAHRGEAFDLCRQAIDRIKETTPIWKKEWSPDGSALWVNLERDERS
jgi:molybdopterin synthase catalytic subunit/molybdopterin converting factor small subunit